jgi:flagellar basal body P-ring formation protein FlgA
LSDIFPTCRIPIFRYDAKTLRQRQGKTAMTLKTRFSGSAIASAVILILAQFGGASAQQIQDQAAIRTAIETVISPRLAAISGASGEVEVGTIDSRLRLEACPNIDVELPPINAATMTAKVSCQDPSWTLYVPVHLHAWINAVIAATNLPPNTTLSGAQLTSGRVDQLASSAGLITDPRQAQGKVLRIGLMAGNPVLSSLLDLPISVRRGQNVVLTLTTQSMTLKTTAMAMEDGRVGDSISVQNPATQKTLHATVSRDGGVEIKF